MYAALPKARLLVLTVLLSPIALHSQPATNLAQSDLDRNRELILVHQSQMMGMDKGTVQSYTKAANYGDPGAQVELGFQLAQPGNAVHDEAQAFRWFQRAAAEESVVAMSNLAVLYFQGRGVRQDAEAGLKWARRAADRNFAPAEINLGSAYWHGWGTAPNHEEAVRWFHRAARHGLGPAQFAVGFAYENGDGVPLDYGKAIEWYSRAAKQKHGAAENNLAIDYEYGRGVPRDVARARKLYEQAVEHGFVRAAVNLARLLSSGNIGSPDPVSACAWLLVAKDEPTATPLMPLICGALNGAGQQSAHKQASERMAKLEQKPSGL
jgi:uncharacterized protein